MTDRSQEWLDELDDEILGQIRQSWNTMDPPPADLDARVRFAIGLEELNFEVARLQGESFAGSGARTAEHARTIMFDCDSLSVMVSVLASDSGVRVDGWVAPHEHHHRVELRVAPQGPEGQGMTYAVDADEAGRFVFTGIPHGLAQLLVHRESAGRTLETPSIVLGASSCEPLRSRTRGGAARLGGRRVGGDAADTWRPAAAGRPARPTSRQ